MNESKRLRTILWLAVAAILVFTAMLFYAMFPTTTPELSAATSSDENLQAQIAKGKYVAIAGDCVACHTAPAGKAFAGGLPLFAHIGTVFSSNITPDKTSGIGNYSLNDFDRAVRYGIKPDGTTMYPAMPFPSYARMTDQDLRALYAYFMHEVKPVQAENRDSDIRWPMSLRWPLAIWRKIYAPATAVVQFDANHYTDPSIARGAYLVQTLGHCGSCHTPRAVTTLQELAMDDSKPAYLAGGQQIDGWFAVNLRGNAGAGLGNWSSQQIADILKTGRNLNSAVVGQPMADVVVHSTQHMTDQDLQAMAVYLKTLPAAPNVNANFTPNNDTAIALKAGHENGRGAELYLDNCAACHRSNGQGAANVFPAIAGNSTVLASSPTSLIRLVLGGSSLPSTNSAPSNLGMPGFGERLSDEETAQLVTFIRHSWGNSSSGISADEVASVRKSVDTGVKRTEP